MWPDSPSGWKRTIRGPPQPWTTRANTGGYGSLRRPPHSGADTQDYVQVVLTRRAAYAAEVGTICATQAAGLGELAAPADGAPDQLAVWNEAAAAILDQAHRQLIAPEMPPSTDTTAYSIFYYQLARLADIAEDSAEAATGATPPASPSWTPSTARSAKPCPAARQDQVSRSVWTASHDDGPLGPRPSVSSVEPRHRRRQKPLINHARVNDLAPASRRPIVAGKYPDADRGTIRARRTATTPSSSRRDRMHL